MNLPAVSTVDEAEVAQFSRIAAEWWDEAGKFRPLHRMNPARIQFIRDAAPPLPHRKTLLDIGCGGGLIAEPMARLGFTVTGADASPENVAVATTHAEQSGLAIRYLATTAEALAAKGERYDVVLALEIVEHVADVPLFLASCAALVKPGGILIVSTLNRTLKSLALAKIGAEYLLRWLPRGTHDWRKFLLPSEIEAQLAPHGMQLTTMSGLSWNPLRDDFSLTPHDLSVNYLMAFVKI